ncbi:MAG: metallophosphoesterase family protein [Candidatus Magnetomorum sp.]|nr:metallophosphoesterase family protein [Candidatus Magnetomorum sp.]
MLKNKQTQVPDAIIGVISDTHGLLRPEVAPLFKHVDAIIHAGDIGSIIIIDQLKSIAPLYAVRGNMDTGKFCEAIPAFDVIEIKNRLFYALHNIDFIDLAPKAAGCHAVIFGHTHQPQSFVKNDILYLNPGSAGPRRNRYPASVAQIHIFQNELKPVFFELS